MHSLGAALEGCRVLDISDVKHCTYGTPDFVVHVHYCMVWMIHANGVRKLNL